MQDSNVWITIWLAGTVFTPLLAAVISLFKKSGYISLLFSIISLLGCIALIYSFKPYNRENQPPLFDLFNLHLDELSLFFILVVNVVVLFASSCTVQDYKNGQPLREDYRRKGFHFWFNFFHFTMLAVLIMDNLVWLWVMVQLTTVSSALLVRYRGDRASAEAAWKFLVITTTGVIFAFLGTILLAYTSKEQRYLRWSELMDPKMSGQLNSNIVILSFLLVLIGYGTKAGLAPMHTWLPDGHGEAPAPASALLSGVMLKTSFYAILRFFTIANLSLNHAPAASGKVGPDSNFITSLLLWSGIFSLLVATPLILKRHRKFKRVLAYHSLEHMGIITFGIGVGTQLAVFGALLHVLNHALTKALMFLVYGYVQDRYWTPGDVQEEPEWEKPGLSQEELKGDEHIQGVWHRLPYVGTLLAGGGLALVGSPPFSIFMSEFIILWAAVSKAWPEGRPDWVMVAAIPIYLITLTLIFGGLVGHLARLLFDRSPKGTLLTDSANFSWAYRLRFISFGLLLFVILITGLIVLGPVSNLLEKSAQIVLGTAKP